MFSGPRKFLLRKFLISKPVPQHPSLHVPSLAVGVHALSHSSLEIKELQFFCGSDLEEEAHLLNRPDSSKYLVHEVSCISAHYPVDTGACMLAEVMNSYKIGNKAVDVFIQ